jgi:hypothetical protein
MCMTVRGVCMVHQFERERPRAQPDIIFNATALTATTIFWKTLVFQPENNASIGISI